MWLHRTPVSVDDVGGLVARNHGSCLVSSDLWLRARGLVAWTHGSCFVSSGLCARGLVARTHGSCLVSSGLWPSARVLWQLLGQLRALAKCAWSGRTDPWQLIGQLRAVAKCAWSGRTDSWYCTGLLSCEFLSRHRPRPLPLRPLYSSCCICRYSYSSCACRPSFTPSIACSDLHRRLCVLCHWSDQDCA
jgi:hypothetical protein